MSSATAAAPPHTRASERALFMEDKRKLTVLLSLCTLPWLPSTLDRRSTRSFAAPFATLSTRCLLVRYPLSRTHPNATTWHPRNGLSYLSHPRRLPNETESSGVPDDAHRLLETGRALAQASRGLLSAARSVLYDSCVVDVSQDAKAGDQARRLALALASRGPHVRFVRQLVLKPASAIDESLAQSVFS